MRRVTNALPWLPHTLRRRLGGPRVRSDCVQKTSPPPGFDHRTFQPVASLYTDYVVLIKNTILASEITGNLIFRGPCVVIYSYNKSNEKH